MDGKCAITPEQITEIELSNDTYVTMDGAITLHSGKKESISINIPSRIVSRYLSPAACGSLSMEARAKCILDRLTKVEKRTVVLESEESDRSSTQSTFRSLFEIDDLIKKLEPTTSIHSVGFESPRFFVWLVNSEGKRFVYGSRSIMDGVVPGTIPQQELQRLQSRIKADGLYLRQDRGNLHANDIETDFVFGDDLITFNYPIDTFTYRQDFLGPANTNSPPPTNPFDWKTHFVGTSKSVLVMVQLLNRGEEAGVIGPIQLNPQFGDGASDLNGLYSQLRRAKAIVEAGGAVVTDRHLISGSSVDGPFFYIKPGQ